MSTFLRWSAVSVMMVVAAAACGSDGSGGNGGSGGATGGSSGTGGATGGSGGAGGTSSGGAAGTATGGSGGAGGTSSGGAAGTATGGAAGTATGGSSGAGGATGGTGGTGGVTCAPTFPALQLTSVVSGLSNALFVTSPPGDTARMFIVEQGGLIRIAKSGALQATPFLDLSSVVTAGGERGLLGLAFHPSYAQNGRFFVYYTQSASPTGDIVIAEYKVSSGNADVAAPTPVQKLVQIGHSTYSNHNGGMLAFGPDGNLYAGIGDGGGGGDPLQSGQSETTHLGKILRIDVDAPGTPLAGNLSGLIWDKGLRNPWRFSFDRANGDLYIGDVGQNAWEEVDYEPAGQGKKNYGWSVMEGTHCYNAATCNQAGLTLPVAEYSHSDGCSITGGYVYRGKAIPCLTGWYIYGDYCSGNLWAFKIEAGAAKGLVKLPITRKDLRSFGEDAAGEVHAVTSSNVYRFDPG
jgi:glucose/arabinose dehydrogenase